VYVVLDFPDDESIIAFATGLSTVGLTGAVGVADDLFEIRQRYKPLLVIVASAPLMYYWIGRGTVYLPLIGTLDIGLLFPLVAVPLAVTSSANFSNMFAGFNGLESGIAVISLGTLTFLSAERGYSTIAMFGAILTFAFAGFMILNWYPARIFPGDTGTLMAGAGIATIGILAKVEFEAILLCIPAAMDFALKAIQRKPFNGRKIHGDSLVNADGTLKPPSYPSLAHAFMRVSPIKERGLVLSLLSLQAVFAIIAVLIALGYA
jgi:UDP-N-acetylglucosamine--dolichyl-phosphate N-acetylglucosaminephosphotransferase